MPLSMHQASAPMFRQGLTALSALIDKTVDQCEERKIDPAVLLADRLAPDMFPFIRQVQLSCDFAKNCMARLAGREPPKFEVVDETAVRYTWAKPNPLFLPALAAPDPVFIYRPAHYLRQFHGKYGAKDKLAALVKAAGVRNWAALHTKVDSLYS